MHYGLAGAELEGDGVGPVGFGEKKSSSVVRKLASRGTITSAGAGGSLGGATSTGTCASGTGVAQDDSASAHSSKIGSGLVFCILQFPFIDG